MIVSNQKLDWRAPYDINHCIRGINRRELIKKLGFTDGRLPPMIKYNPLCHNDYSLMKEYNKLQSKKSKALVVQLL